MTSFTITTLSTLNEILSETKLRLIKLNRQRTSMEKEMEALVDDLRSPRGPNNYIAGIPGEGRLVDDQGFPRADIDLYDVRTKRHRYVCLQTDHKNVMKNLEIELKATHRVQIEINKIQPEPEPKQMTQEDKNEKGDPSEVTVSSLQSETPQTSASQKPFAIVQSVGPDSPSDLAGLKIGDLILSFGTECITLSNLSNLVHENEPISVVVERKGTIVHLTLVPKKWSGRGMLGVYMEPC